MVPCARLPPRPFTTTKCPVDCVLRHGTDPPSRNGKSNKLIRSGGFAGVEVCRYHRWNQVLQTLYLFFIDVSSVVWTGNLGCPIEFFENPERNSEPWSHLAR